MKREEAIKFWEFRYENAKDYTDPHWEAQERREHREYVEALRVAIEALQTDLVRCKDCKHFVHYADGCGVCTERDNILTYQNQNDFCSYGERKGGDSE